jgi:hypothetical protein
MQQELSFSACKAAADCRPYHMPGVLNEGIGGNHLLTDALGPNALARFDRDVLVQTGVRCLMVLEGVNAPGGLNRTAK